MRNSYDSNKKMYLKNYLRADPHTQIYQLNGKDLVSEDMFWGTDTSNPLYLDYTKIDGRCIRIADGISYNNIQTKEDIECDDWLKHNIFQSSSNMLYVIQGYAGCGKTTLMRNVIRSKQKNHSLCYIDVGEKWSYECEPCLFFEETLSMFLNCLQSIFKRSNWIKIWEKFLSLGRDNKVENLDTKIRSIISPLRTIMSYHQQSIIGNENFELNIENVIADIGSYLSERFNKSNDRYHNQGQVGVIISLLMLLNCADSIVNTEENKSYIIVYDNLDVITNPAIPAEMVLSLWISMSNYKKYIKKVFDNDKNTPNFSIYIAVRKVLFSHITAYLPELEQTLQQDLSCAIVCDVSELYLSQKVLEHRIEYWLQNKDVDSETKEKFNRLNRITSIMGEVEVSETDDEYYAPKQAIDLDGLFNHNFRACANMLSELLEDSTYSDDITKIFESSKNPDWQKTSTLIFAISSIYRKLRIWNKFGFRCNGFDTSIYPTTLFRIILTFLYVSKVGHTLSRKYLPREDMPDNDFVSLSSIIELMGKVPFIKIKTSDTNAQIDNHYNKVVGKDTSDRIISLLAEMCSTGNSITEPTIRGYEDEDELWRRPIYFVGGVKLAHTATSVDELKKYFIKCALDETKAENLKFSITDEGCVIVSDIIASFEFYSARYNSSKYSKPLHQVTDSSELRVIIQSVFDAISICCKRQILFMKKYIESYDENLSDGDKKDMYLKEFFHPRTNPRFHDILGVKNLVGESFRPQLHIVRVIYNHIAYLNEVKNLFAKNNMYDMCKVITKFIGYYLNLYKETFFSVLENTIGAYNNLVYKDLELLYMHQIKKYEEDTKENIDITRTNKELLNKLKEECTNQKTTQVTNDVMQIDIEQNPS